MEEEVYYYITYEPEDMVIWASRVGWNWQAVEFECGLDAQKAALIAERTPVLYNLPENFNKLKMRTIPSTSRLYYKTQEGVAFGWEIRKNGVADLLEKVIQELDLVKV